MYFPLKVTVIAPPEDPSLTIHTIISEIQIVDAENLKLEYKFPLTGNEVFAGIEFISNIVFTSSKFGSHEVAFSPG